MKFGIQFPVGVPGTGGHYDPDYVATAAKAAEQLGFESIWTGEHTSITVGYDKTYPYSDDGTMFIDDDACWPDPFVLLAFIAAQTEHIKLATGVLLLPQRQVVLTAKEAATLDRLSKGRFMLGVGVGWQREESEALGVAWPGRGPRMDEYIEVLRTLWTEDTVTFAGRSVAFERLKSQPKPVQMGGPPIIVGGHSDAAIRRAARYGDGIFLVGDAPTVERAIKSLEREVQACGRSMADVEVTVGVSNELRQIVGAEVLDAIQRPQRVVDEMRRFEDAGVSRIVEFRVTENDLSHLLEVMGAIAEHVIEKF